MIPRKALLTLFTALAAFGCAAIVENEQASRHDAGRQGGAGLHECFARDDGIIKGALQGALSVSSSFELSRHD
jgi:hypothetical protein